MGTQMNVYEAKAQLSQLIERAVHGEDVVIARAGKPAVRLVKWQPAPKRIPGAWRSQVTIADDFDDFTAADDTDWYGA